MEIQSQLVAFYSAVIIVAGYYITDYQNESPKKVPHIITSTNRFYLTLNNLGMPQSLIALHNPKDTKQISPNEENEDNDSINDRKNRANQNNDNEVNLRVERKHNHPFRIKFDFTATGIPNLLEMIKLTPLLRLNNPTESQKDENEKDYKCTLAVVDCISKCSVNYPKEKPKNPSESSRQWLCIMNCGNICGTTQTDAVENSTSANGINATGLVNKG